MSFLNLLRLPSPLRSESSAKVLATGCSILGGVYVIARPGVSGVDICMKITGKVIKCHYRAFLLMWPTSVQIYQNRRKCLHKKRVQLPQDWFGTPTRPPFHCFGTPIWPPWHHVKTLYRVPFEWNKYGICSLPCSMKILRFLIFANFADWPWSAKISSHRKITRKIKHCKN